ncbi:hypothetical protein Lal_00045529 [Lupinus albus]|uniref:Uncharacterized protein n=1 Tax=Lupinus albus TaxID=3870 RepID=A0A6A5NNK1_LUPAL|nr:hypothetical protein Lalb_Chr14g0368411 [Lupinus albus]KAF1886298.1 hypothetical protein Lal_00045529 [Lupinus albus]
MQMKKNLWIMLMITIIVVSSQFSFVHSRVLISKELKLKTHVGDGREEFKEEEMTFDVSSNNYRTHHSSLRVAFRLASGPSKKGPGH